MGLQVVGSGGRSRCTASAGNAFGWSHRNQTRIAMSIASHSSLKKVRANV
jgi:hypothetical protein